MAPALRLYPGYDASTDRATRPACWACAAGSTARCAPARTAGAAWGTSQSRTASRHARRHPAAPSPYRRGTSGMPSATTFHTFPVQTTAALSASRGAPAIFPVIVVESTAQPGCATRGVGGRPQTLDRLQSPYRDLLRSALTRKATGSHLPCTSPQPPPLPPPSATAQRGLVSLQLGDRIHFHNSGVNRSAACRRDRAPLGQYYASPTLLDCRRAQQSASPTGAVDTSLAVSPLNAPARRWSDSRAPQQHGACHAWSYPRAAGRRPCDEAAHRWAALPERGRHTAEQPGRRRTSHSVPGPAAPAWHGIRSCWLG